MSKAVLVSIKPKWCEKIASGKKTIEVRKTRPKLPTPFKCYIYCTSCKSFYSVGSLRYGDDELYRIPNGKIKYGTSVELMACDDDKYGPENFLNRKVIGEFVCDRIITSNGVHGDELDHTGELSYNEYKLYGKGGYIYGWHISEMKIYDTPKELMEFFKPCSSSCNYIGECGGTNAERCLFPMERPPKSWCYVEELT